MILQLPATTDLEPARRALTPNWLLARKARFSLRSRNFLKTLVEHGFADDEPKLTIGTSTYF